jgi:signal transduction histidine kinase
MAPHALTLRRVLWLLAVVPLLAPGSASGQSVSARTVLVLHWSTEDFPTSPIINASIREVFASAGPSVDVNTEYLESDRFPQETASNAFRQYVREKYRDRRIDAVIAVAEPALSFALAARSELFPGVPIVYSGIVERSGSIRGEDGGLAGVVSAAAYGATAELALTMHPGTDRIFVVAHSPTVLLEDSVRPALESVAKRVAITYITEPSVPRLIEAVKAVPSGSLILYVRHSQEQPGHVLTPYDIASLVSEASPVPVYGVADAYIGLGVVGGVVTDTRTIGRHVGEISRRILEGARPEHIPIEQLPRNVVFDWRELRRWHLAARSLPAGSIVRFRTPSMWEEHRTAIVAALGVLLLQSLLIAGLIFERRRRRQAESEARRSLTAMAHLDRRAAMGELATSLAHELNQPLNAILQNAGVAQMILASNTVPPALGEITEIVSDIRKDDLRASEVIRRMRGLLQKHELETRPVDLNELAQDTVAIVRHDAWSRQIDVVLELADRVGPVLGDRVHLQQVLLNFLMNALDAVAGVPPERRRVLVSTTERDGEVRLAVSDTGIGIPADALAQIFEPFYTTKSEGSGMGMGLAIARSIVEAHAGRLAAESNPGGGTIVWLSLPVTPAPVP